jgi:hypothetical protein
MGTVESWWNGSHAGMARRRVRLRQDGDRWSVELDGPGERYELLPAGDEAAARAELARRLDAGQPWQRVDQLNRRP